MATKTKDNKQILGKVSGILGIILGIVAFPGTILVTPGAICIAIGLCLSVFSIVKHQKVLGIIGIVVNLGAIIALFAAISYWSQFSQSW